MQSGDDRASSHQEAGVVQRTTDAPDGIWFERPLPAQYRPLLGTHVVIVGFASDTPADPWTALPQARAIIAGGRLRYDAAAMDRGPNLRVISRTGIGVDNVDVAEATRRGILVCNAPDAPTISTAEHTLTLLLAVVKQIRLCARVLEHGEAATFINVYRGIEVLGRCLGLVGLGRIGRRVATLAAPLGMKVIGYDPFVAQEALNGLDVELMPTLEALLQQADFVSLHLPYTPATRHLMNAERLGQMKPGAVLINCGRGGLVDERALLAALESGHLFGAGLDVFDPEPPPPDHPLLQRQDVIATPHIAGGTDAGKDRLWRAAILHALQALRGELPSSAINPEAWSSAPAPPGATSLRR